MSPEPARACLRARGGSVHVHAQPAAPPLTRRLPCSGVFSRPMAPPPAGCRWRRVLLKLSGEALAGQAGFGIDGDMVLHFASQIASMQSEGLQVRGG